MGVALRGAIARKKQAMGVALRGAIARKNSQKH